MMKHIFIQTDTSGIRTIIGLVLLLCTILLYHTKVNGQERILFPIKTDQQTGFIDREGALVIPPQIDMARSFHQGRARVNIDQKWGYIDTSGEIVIEAVFDGAGDFFEGLARVKVKNKWGYIDTIGNIIIKPRFDGVGNFSEGFATIRKGKNLKPRWGFINRFGDVVIKTKFGRAGDFSEGLACVQHPLMSSDIGKFGYIDTTGTWAISAEFSSAFSFSEGMAAVKQDERWFYINRSGTPVVPDRTIKIQDLTKERTLVSVPDPFEPGKRRQVYRPSVDDLEVIVIDNARPMTEGFAAIRFHDRWGYVDRTGRLVIRPQFHRAFDFSGGLARVKVYKEWYYINTRGQKAIAGPFEMAYDFQDGLASVYFEGQQSYIDTEGKVVWTSAP